MIIYRIALTEYSDMTGEGARLYGGRWNLQGEPTIYGSGSIAAALLERLTIDPELFSSNRYLLYSTIFIDCPDELILKIDLSKLPTGWDAIPAPTVSARYGSGLFAQNVFCFEVPSVVDTSSRNYVINPLNPLVKRLSIKTTSLKLDYRIIRY